MPRISSILASIPIALAVGLLVLLVLISTSSDSATQRRLDLGVRQSLELTSRINTLAARAVDSESPWREALTQLDGEREARLDLAREAVDGLYPATPTRLEQLRRLAERGLNAIDLNLEPRPGIEAVRTDFAAIEAASGVYRARLTGLLDAHDEVLRLQAVVGTESRTLAGALRERGEDRAADLIFATVAAVLEDQPDPAADGQSAARITAMRDALRELEPDVEAQAQLARLVEALDVLPTMRARLVDSLGALQTNPLARLLAEFRERATTDALYTLTTANDARVLLNVYTAMLLLVLIYLGARLAVSNRVLDRYNEDLEQRVQERTRDLEQANHDLKESQVQLVQAEKMSSLGQLVAGVMHEVNTPLMFVQSNVLSNADAIADVVTQLGPVVELSELLRGGAPDKDALRSLLGRIRCELDPEVLRESARELKELSDDSIDGLEQISELVQSLKDFSRLDRADEDRFDVREGLEKTLTITRNLLKYGIEIEKDYEEVPEILCAPSKINQVFINLITNAVQAMDGTGHLYLGTRGLGDWVQITVRDSGCGIPAEQLDRVTDPFFTTKPVGQGTGLGLSIVRQIIDEHGGHLEVNSVVGEGTEFVVHLPVSRNPTEEAA